MKTASRYLRWLPVIALPLLCGVILSTGCVGSHRGMETRKRSTTVDFLYPGKEHVATKPGVPSMTLPLDIGIAFVPETGRRGDAGFSDEQKERLMTSVAEHFKDQPFIRNIEIIPTAYLKPGGGFANLDQVRTMFGVDVIALVSYDQIQHTDERAYSFAYLTVIGMYSSRHHNFLMMWGA